jgi:hypothetical protein
MKGKNLAILLALVVVIGGASLLLQKGNLSTWSNSAAGSGSGKILNLPLNDVAFVNIKAVEGELTLLKRDTGWVVVQRAEYPADYAKLSELLRKLWDLKTVQEVKVGPSQLPRLNLVEPSKDAANSGVLAEFKDKDGKQLGALLLGKAYTKKAEGEMAMLGDLPIGRYVKTLAEGGKVSLVTETFQDVKPDPADWLDKEFFKVSDALEITVDRPTDGQHWTITRESPTADWKLADAKPGEELDKSKLSPYGFLFANAAFVDVLGPEISPLEVGLDKATAVTIESSDHFLYKILLGKLAGENYPLSFTVNATFPTERTPGKDEKPEDKAKLDESFKADIKKLQDKLAAEKKFESRIYLVAKATVEAVFKNRSELLVEKKPEAPAAGARATPAGTAPAPAAPTPAAPVAPAPETPAATPPAAPAPAPAVPPAPAKP